MMNQRSVISQWSVVGKRKSFNALNGNWGRSSSKRKMVGNGKTVTEAAVAITEWQDVSLCHGTNQSDNNNLIAK